MIVCPVVVEMVFLSQIQASSKMRALIHPSHSRHVCSPLSHSCQRFPCFSFRIHCYQPTSSFWTSLLLLELAVDTYNQSVRRQKRTICGFKTHGNNSKSTFCPSPHKNEGMFNFFLRYAAFPSSSSSYEWFHIRREE